MTQTNDGNKKRVRTMKKKLGGKKALREYMSELGKKGGAKSAVVSPASFANDPKRASKLGKKGGQTSKRGPAKRIRANVDQPEGVRAKQTKEEFRGSVLADYPLEYEDLDH